MLFCPITDNQSLNQPLTIELSCVYCVHSFSVGYLLNTILAPARGLTMNPHSAIECEKILSSALSTLESFWLKDSQKFLLGYDQPTIADLSAVCELMQFEVKKRL